jgi:hypothetical protein
MMRQRLCLAPLVAALAAVLVFGLAWHSANESRAMFEDYSRLVDQCRLQPDAALRLSCFDGTIGEQPGD